MKIINIVKNIFNGENYDDLCQKLNKIFGKNVKALELKQLTENILKYNNNLVLEEEGVWRKLLMAVVFGSLILFGTYKCSENVYNRNQEKFEIYITTQGYSNVEYTGFSLGGGKSELGRLKHDITHVISIEDRGEVFGVGEFIGEKDGNVYKIILKSTLMGPVILVVEKIETLPNW